MQVGKKTQRIKLCLGVDEEGAKRLWVRIKGQAKMGVTVTAIYNWPPDQQEEVDEAFHRQQEAAVTITGPRFS